MPLGLADTGFASKSPLSLDSAMPSDVRRWLCPAVACLLIFGGYALFILAQ